MLLIKEGGAKEFQSVTAEELAERFNIPIEKITKSPEFIINPDRIARKKAGQSREISVPAGSGFFANMFVKIAGKTLEIRYCESINQVEKGDKLVDEYFPRKLQYLGENMLMEADNLDLCVYMFLYPLCKQSPFRNSIKEKYHWGFKDLEQESEEEMASTNELMNALNAINSYSGESLKVIARSFGFTGVDDTEDIILKANLVKLVQNPNIKNAALEFNKNINSQVHIFRGLSLNAIEKGLFVVSTMGLNEYWAWGEGDRKGQRIVDITNGSVSKNDTLLLHIQNNIQEYYPIIYSANRTMAAKNKTESFFEKQAPIDLNAMFNQQSASEFGGSTDDSGEDLAIDNGNSRLEVTGNVHLNQNGNVTVEPNPVINLTKVTEPVAPAPVQPAAQQIPPAEVPAWMQDRPAPGRKPGAKNK